MTRKLVKMEEYETERILPKKGDTKTRQERCYVASINTIVTNGHENALVRAFQLVARMTTNEQGNVGRENCSKKQVRAALGYMYRASGSVSCASLSSSSQP